MGNNGVVIEIRPCREKQFGISVDVAFDIKIDGLIIGEGGISKMTKNNTIYLEWIELYENFRGKCYLRKILQSISKCFHVNILVLESSAEYRNIYEHLGAVQVGYDDFREIWEYHLSADVL